MSEPPRSQELRVAIDARLPLGEWGGVQQVVEGLASGVRTLVGAEEYVFLVQPGGRRWLERFVGGNARLIEVRAGYGKTRLRRAYDAMAVRLPTAASLARKTASRLGAGEMPLPRSNGYLEGLGVDVVHFATPQAYLTRLPSVYQPHDLLHRHHPEQFSAVHRRYRDHAYRTFSERASVVAVMTEFGRSDLADAYGLPVERVAVVPWAPVIGTDVASGSAASQLLGRIPSRYLLYPAQTWPHKNHLRLLDALAALRDQGTVVPIVCTGKQTEHFPAIRERINALRLGDQVWFVGYVSDAALDAVIGGATALVFPSLFEGWGLPVVEAFSLGIPVACSNAAALPEVASGAALLFDPNDTGAIAEAVRRLWQDDGLRNDLRRRGTARAAQLSWEKTARTFRAIYRLVAGRTLSDEDRALLGPPTFLAPPQGAT